MLDTFAPLDAPLGMLGTSLLHAVMAFAQGLGKTKSVLDRGQGPYPTRTTPQRPSSQGQRRALRRSGFAATPGESS